MNRQVPNYKRRKAAAAVATPKAQRGAAAVFAAAALLAMILSTLLALNIGRLYYAQRDLQKLAVMGALAAVESASGCSGTSGMRSTATATTQVTSIIQANLPAGSGTTASQLLTAINGIGPVQLGMESTTGVNPTTGKTDGYYHFISLADNDARIDAAVVNLAEPSPALIGSMFFPNFAPFQLHASATAMQRPLGSFTIGSTLLNVNTSNSALLNPLLSALLGTSLNLSAVDYQNLASVKLSLANLEVAAGVNDLNSLLSLNTNLAGVQQLLAAATAQVNPSVANLVSGLTLGTTNAGESVPLAQLLGAVGDGLNPTVTEAASLVPSLDLLDLLREAGEAALGNSPGSFITLTATPSIAGLSTYVFLSVQQPPQISNDGVNFGFGPVGTAAQTEQVTLGVRASVDTTGGTGFNLVGAVLNLLNGLLSLLGSSITIAPINIGLDLAVASATGTLESINCPVAAGSTPSATVGVQTALVTLSLGGFTGNASTDPALSTSPVNLLSIQGTGLLSAVSATIGLKTGEVSTQLGPNTGTAGPFTIYGTAYQPAALAQTSPQTWIFPACNSTVFANPSQCGNTTDPNNPDTPVAATDLTAGLATLIGNLTASNNLQIVVANNVNLSSIIDPLASALNTLLVTPLTSVLDSILNPLLQLLGIQVGSATILMNGIETGKQIIVNTNLPGSPNF
jgi:uncharacterized membrane protein